MHLSVSKKLVSLIMLICSISFQTLAQESKELTIGDEVPDIEIKNIINYHTPSVKLSDFKGKLLILNFWATWCSPCVGGFPKLDSLQNKYSNNLQILNITTEERKKVVDFFENMEIVRSLKPVSVVSDDILQTIFYHYSLPHYVWINKDMRVIAITDGEEITAQNIEDALASKGRIFGKKVDSKARIERSNGVIFTPTVKVNNNGHFFLKEIQEGDVIVNSTLTRYQEGALSGGMKKTNLVSLTNTSIFSLYRAAFWKFGMELFDQNSTIIEVEDSVFYEMIRGIKTNRKSLKQTPEDLADWRKKTQFCYELKVPEGLSDKKFDIMVDDLNKYFGALYNIEGVMEKRISKCLVLTRTTTEDRIASKFNTTSENFNKFLLELKNGTIEDLIVYLRQSLQLYSIINETNYKNKIDIRLNCQLSDLKALNAELNKYGLQLLEEERSRDVVVIRRKSK